MSVRITASNPCWKRRLRVTASIITTIINKTHEYYVCQNVKREIEKICLSEIICQSDLITLYQYIGLHSWNELFLRHDCALSLFFFVRVPKMRAWTWSCILRVPCVCPVCILLVSYVYPHCPACILYVYAHYPVCNMYMCTLWDLIQITIAACLSPVYKWKSPPLPTPTPTP